jgi:putative transposase
MIEADHKKLSIAEQCRVLNLNRSAYYYECSDRRNDADLEDLKLILAVLGEKAFYGYRKITRELRNTHRHLTSKRVRRIMHQFGLRAIYPKLNLSSPRKGHKKYPYLLRGKEIQYPNQVWATDVTYLRLPGGFVYLTAVMDLFSRKVLSWRLSNSMDATFCVAAVREAIDRYGVPAIFNTDQGSQFTSDAFINMLKEHHIEISMDGKGRALDNVYVERLWRSLKYEDIYLNSYETFAELQRGVNRYFQFYNTERFHQGLGYATPEMMHQSFVLEDPLPLAG